MLQQNCQIHSYKEQTRTQDSPQGSFLGNSPICRQQEYYERGFLWNMKTTFSKNFGNYFSNSSQALLQKNSQINSPLKTT